VFSSREKNYACFFRSVQVVPAFFHFFVEFFWRVGRLQL